MLSSCRGSSDEVRENFVGPIPRHVEVSDGDLDVYDVLRRQAANRSRPDMINSESCLGELTPQR